MWVHVFTPHPLRIGLSPHYTYTSSGINTEGGTPGFPPSLKIDKYYTDTYCRVWYTCTVTLHLRTGFQKPQEAVSGTLTWKIFLGKHTNQPLVWVRYRMLNFPPLMKNPVLIHAPSFRTIILKISVANYKVRWRSTHTFTLKVRVTPSSVSHSKWCSWHNCFFFKFHLAGFGVGHKKVFILLLRHLGSAWIGKKIE